MCGIGLIVSGIQLANPLLKKTNHDDPSFESTCNNQVLSSEASGPTVDHLIECLKKRGPDCIGSQTVYVKGGGHGYHWDTKAYIDKEEMGSNLETLALPNEESGCLSQNNYNEASHVILQFVGASLQLRGAISVFQPLKDCHDNLLVYNGEVFDGLSLGSEENDTEAIMSALCKCCSCLCHALRENVKDCVCTRQGQLMGDHRTVPEFFSSIRGPWALVYWQAKSKILWFGRDAIGRRSLLIHWPSQADGRLLLSSVAPFSTETPKFSAVQESFRDVIIKNGLKEDDQCHESILGESFGISDSKGPHSLEEKAACDLDSERKIQESSVFDYWKELPCAMFSITIGSMKETLFANKPGCGHCAYTFPVWVVKHAWQGAALNKILGWDRRLVDPVKHGYSRASAVNEGLSFVGTTVGTICGGEGWSTGDSIDAHENLCFDDPEMKQQVQGNYYNVERNCSNKSELCMKYGTPAWPGERALRVLEALKLAVQRRTSHIIRNEWIQKAGEPQSDCVKRKNVDMDSVSPVAILFSGGLDSMILAALADQCLGNHCVIDLLNVSFEGELAPDRLSAIEGVEELRRVSPSRRWRLVKVDGTILSLDMFRTHLLSLICPSKTYMDLNIGGALWLAASGDGWVEEGVERKYYKSEARVLLVGTGADEQCAGYSRHRTKFKIGSWDALQQEMQLDMHRLWKRNLGRDDRCIGDNGKEARFPFLDEDVIQTLLDIPLWEIADLNKPLGEGDKKILREVALVMGLKKVASLPKRAIQFGSRIARESNRIHFGSNRSANQVSAGGAVLQCLQK